MLKSFFRTTMAALMVLGMSMPAWADDTYTIYKADESGVDTCDANECIEQFPIGNGSCTEQDMRTVAYNEGLSRNVPIVDFNTYVAYAAERLNSKVSVSYHYCEGLDGDNGSNGVGCMKPNTAGGDPALCTYMNGHLKPFNPYLPENNTPEEPEEAATQNNEALTEVAGPATHVQDGEVAIFQFGEEGDNKTLTLWPGEPSNNRDAACRTPALMTLFRNSPADLGDESPLSTFPQLLASLNNDTNNRGYTWFAPCKTDGSSVHGFVCTDPAYTLSRGITLRDCAYGEGTLR